MNDALINRKAFLSSPPSAIRTFNCSKTPVRRRLISAKSFVDDKAWSQFELERGVCNIASPYTPQLIESEVLKSPADAIRVMFRGVRMISEFGFFWACLKMDDVIGAASTQSTKSVKMRAAQLRELLTRLGPSFIKAGQVLANRPDILREDFMNELCTLQDDVPPFSDEEAMRIIEEDLERPLEAIFSYVSERPVAAASLGQVYRAKLRGSGEEVAVKVQRPGIEPVIYRDLYLFRMLALLFDKISRERLGCNAQLIVDEFGEKLLEELDYVQEARNISDFRKNFEKDPSVKIPWVRPDLSNRRVLVMEWINGIRCTDPERIKQSVQVPDFVKCGVRSGLRQLLEFGLFHGDPHPGNIFALKDGRIAYVDFGNVAQLSQTNKQVLVDAVVHAVNEDYANMADDFIKLGFLAPGTDTTPIIPALEKIWKDSLGQSMAVFNFRTVTSKFNELVFQYPIRIPERYSLVIRSLLTQEGICLTLDPSFHFLEVAYPYVARRLLTDEDPALRERLIQVLFQDGRFQWKRLENLIALAKDGAGGAALDLNDTLKDAVRLLLLDSKVRRQVIEAFTEDDRLHFDELNSLLEMVGDDINPQQILSEAITELPSLSFKLANEWSDSVLSF